MSQKQINIVLLSIAAGGLLFLSFVAFTDPDTGNEPYFEEPAVATVATPSTTIAPEPTEAPETTVAKEVVVTTTQAPKPSMPPASIIEVQPDFTG